MYCELCGVTLKKSNKEALDPYECRETNTDLKQFKCLMCNTVYRESNTQKNYKYMILALAFTLTSLGTFLGDDLFDIFSITDQRLMKAGILAFYTFIIAGVQKYALFKNEKYDMIGRKI